MGVVKQRKAASLAVDSWGVDFALLDSQGRLISLPVHYRDQRTKGVMEQTFAKLGEKRIYERTGIKSMPFNTLYQLYSMVLQNDEQLKLAQTFLMIPDLFNFWFTGEKVCEYTIASTSQCYSVPQKEWAYDLLETLSIPTTIFPEVVSPSTVLGGLKFGERKTRVIATACHDTASAVAAVPFEGPGIYISSGTWSLIGTEVEEPILSEQAMKYGFTNEGGVNCIRFLKNATGMWLIEECNRAWGLDYGEIVALAAKAPSFPGFINPDDHELLFPGKMSEKILDYLAKTGQTIPNDVGVLARLIFESLVLNYKYVVERLEQALSKSFEVIHIVGGAARNDLVNQFLANATKKEVVAGPYEAAAIGNALVQFIALGEISGLEEGRRLVRNSFELKRFSPKKDEVEVWEEAYAKWKQLTGKCNAITLKEKRPKQNE